MTLARGGHGPDSRHGGLEDPDGQDAFKRLLAGLIDLVPPDAVLNMFLDKNAKRVPTNGHTNSWYGRTPFAVKIVDDKIDLSELIDIVNKNTRGAHGKQAKAKLMDGLDKVIPLHGTSKYEFFQRLAVTTCVSKQATLWSFFSQLVSAFMTSIESNICAAVPHRTADGEFHAAEDVAAEMDLMQCADCMPLADSSWSLSSDP